MRYWENGKPAALDVEEARLAIDTAIRDVGKDGRVAVDAMWLRGLLNTIEAFDEEKVSQEGFDVGLVEGKEDANRLVEKMNEALASAKDGTVSTLREKVGEALELLEEWK